jgi:hypothetical protein
MTALDIYMVCYRDKSERLFTTFRDANDYVNNICFPGSYITQTSWSGELFHIRTSGLYGKFKCKVDENYTLEVYRIGDD